MTPKEKALDIIRYRISIAEGNLDRAKEQFEDFTTEKMVAPYEIKSGKSPSDILVDLAYELTEVIAAYDYVDNLE